MKTYVRIRTVIVPYVSTPFFFKNKNKIMQVSSAMRFANMYTCTYMIVCGYKVQCDEN